MNKRYEAFIKHIYAEYIAPRLISKQKDLSPNEPNERVEQLTQAIQELRGINRRPSEQAYGQPVLSMEKGQEIFNAVKSAMAFNNDLVGENEIADVIQDYFLEILDGIEVDSFPEADFDVLRKSGTSDPKLEIDAMAYVVRSRKRQILNRNKGSFSKQLLQAGNIIEEQYAIIERSPEKKRAIFKGMGSIAQGAVLSIVDSTVAMGLWPVPLSVETTTLGVVASITTGIGTILIGIGELRGE
ncbi:hypothetical protein ANRL3_02850 [Anaerolineae bacterium]|nr:hypothetical protein ANRL3_02850 [Anaerolineae bacterium]